jgi:hypothetical protein
MLNVITAFDEFESHPSALISFEILHSSISGPSHLAPLKERESGIGNEDRKTKCLQSYRHVIEPVSVFILGFIVLVSGWWTLRNCHSWNDWGWGLAGMLIGWQLLSFGLAIFLTMVF